MWQPRVFVELGNVARSSRRPLWSVGWRVQEATLVDTVAAGLGNLPGRLAGAARKRPVRTNSGKSELAPELTTVEGLTGIEPALSAWEAEVLPLNYSPMRRGAVPS